MKKQTSVYDIATERIIALLEAGTAPWHKPWSNRESGLAPMNYQSKRSYTGINFFLLSACFEDPYFLTFKQVQEMGGQIRKGSSAVPVFFWNWLYLDADGHKVDSEQEAEEKIPYLRYYSVFNAMDIEGIDFKYPEMPAFKPHQRIARCEDLVTATAAVVEPNQSRACYSPFLDRIRMPELEQFDGAEEYYSTLFHELGHWTGHRSRLNRFKEDAMPATFGSQDYSREELIAEMTAAFLCAHCRIDTPQVTENSAAYLQGWINALQGDSKLVVTAAAQAQKAADFILGRAKA